MHHRHALYDSRRLTDRHWLCTASLATHAVLGSLYESYRDFVAYRYQYRESVGTEMLHRNLLVMERTITDTCIYNMGRQRTIPLFVGMIHLLLHRLVWNS